MQTAHARTRHLCRVPLLKMKMAAATPPQSRGVGVARARARGLIVGVVEGAQGQSVGRSVSQSARGWNNKKDAWTRDREEGLCFNVFICLFVCSVGGASAAMIEKHQIQSFTLNLLVKKKAQKKMNNRLRHK